MGDDGVRGHTRHCEDAVSKSVHPPIHFFTGAERLKLPDISQDSHELTPC